MFDRDARRFELLRMYCQGSAIAAVALACLVLCGWAFHIELLKTLLPGLVSVKANTAVGLAFSGISLWLLLPGESPTLRGRVARLLGFMVAIIGAATLCEYLFGLNLRIDELLFTEPAGAMGTYLPGRISPMTSIAFLAIGLALMLLDWKTQRGRRPAQGLILLATLIAIMAVSGYVYHASALYRIRLYTQVALPTAIALFLLSGAIFFARPRAGIAGDLTSEGSGGIMARRFLPAIFVVPLFLGWIRLKGQLAGLYGTELGLALYCVANIVVFAFLVCLNAQQMNKEYDERAKAELALSELNRELEGRVAERTASLERQAVVLNEQAALLDLAHDSIFVRDMNNRITFWNEGATRKYGWTAEQVLGHVAHELLHTKFPTPPEQVRAELLAQNIWEGELSHTRADGSRITVASRWALQRDVDGTPHAILEINNDITERKQAEEALEQSFNNQMRFKDEFLSHVSHELRSPLTAIKQFTTIQLGGLAGVLNADQREYQQIVLRNVLQLQAMIDDLLEATRLETGKLSVEPERVSLWDAVTDSLNTLQESARAKGVTLSCDLPPDLPSAHADPTRLRQILIILLDNAVKFSPDWGDVRVAARLLPQYPQFLLVEVSDTGCGMSEEAAGRIFQRLYQVSDPLEASRKGLGLGLFICKELVTRHGGQIWVKSRPQEGSVFSLTLPVFSLYNSIAPLLKNNEWPAQSVALITVEASALRAGTSRQSQKEWAHEIRNLVGRCLLPDLAVLLPRMSCNAETECVFVAAFGDEEGATALARRIRDQSERLLGSMTDSLSVSVSYTMLKMVPSNVGASVENIVTSMATNLEESIKSQSLSEAIPS